MFENLANPQQRAFLSAYAQRPSITRAARAAGIDRSNHYYWMRNDPAYAEAFAIAEEMAGDVLESLAVKRATEGLIEPVLYQGELVIIEGKPLMRRKIDNRLLEKMLARFKPQQYATTKHEHTGKDGKPIEQTIQVIVRSVLDEPQKET